MNVVQSLAFSRTQKRVAAKVCDLHHHAIVHNAVGGLEATVHLNVTGVEVGHPLQRGTPQTECSEGALLTPTG